MGRQEVVPDRVNFKTLVSVQFRFESFDMDGFQNSAGEVFWLPIQHFYVLPGNLVSLTAVNVFFDG